MLRVLADFISGTMLNNDATIQDEDGITHVTHNG